jgi:hypothetical protein
MDKKLERPMKRRKKEKKKKEREKGRTGKRERKLVSFWYFQNNPSRHLLNVKRVF